MSKIVDFYLNSGSSFNIDKYFSLRDKFYASKDKKFKHLRLYKKLKKIEDNNCSFLGTCYKGENVFKGRPNLPHGVFGVFISQYAKIGENCTIYQNVTIGSVDKKAPKIGDNCLIGANACIVGDITIGDNVKIGAGAVVSHNIESNCTVVSQKPRVIRADKNEI